jgi:hypothetical protein
MRAPKTVETEKFTASKAGIQGQAKERLDSRFRGNERNLRQNAQGQSAQFAVSSHHVSPAKCRTTFSSKQEMGPLKPRLSGFGFHRLPQKVIEPTAKTAPPLSVSK